MLPRQIPFSGLRATWKCAYAVRRKGVRIRGEIDHIFNLMWL